MYFTDDQTANLKDLIGKIEKRTGVQLVAAVVGKCDSYPEIPWKAFALTSAVSSLAVLVQALVHDGCALLRVPQFAVAFVIGTGAACALLSVFWHAFGRLFLDRGRAEAEIDQYARAFFFEHELFRTSGRTGILLLVGLYERRVVIVPDSGVADRLGEKALPAVIDRMAPHLRRKDRFRALEQGLASLEAELLAAGFVPSSEAGNEIVEALIQDKGEDR